MEDGPEPVVSMKDDAKVKIEDDTEDEEPKPAPVLSGLSSQSATSSQVAAPESSVQHENSP